MIVVSGLAVGAVYTLVAYAINIVYLSTRVMNFAQGELVMLGAMIGLNLLVDASWSFWLMVPVTVVAVSLVAVFIEKVAVSPARNNLAGLGWLLSTLGAGIVIGNLAQIRWGTSTLRFPSLLSDAPIGVLGVRVVPQELLVLGVSFVIMILFEMFRAHTLMGKAVKAIAFNRRSAQLSGIPTDRIVTLTFLISGVLSAVAGILVAPITFASPSMGFAISLKGFFSAIVGGLGNFRGAMLSGLLIGVIEGLSAWFIAPSARNIASYLVLILILMWRPQGLVGYAPVSRA